MHSDNPIIRNLLGRAGGPQGLDAAAWRRIRQGFPGQAFDQFAEHLAALADGSALQEVFLAAGRIGPLIAGAMGPDAALGLAGMARRIADDVSPSAAVQLLVHAPRAAEHLKSAQAFAQWLTCLQDLAQGAPDAVLPVLARTETLLGQLDAEGFRGWIQAGLSGPDTLEWRAAFFSLAEESSLRVLQQEASDVRLSHIERRLAVLAKGLWDIAPIIRPAQVKTALHVPRRTSFDGRFVRMPETFAGFSAEEATALYKAAIAHVGAHLTYSNGLFEKQTLKPIQIALVSLIEDARVEALAGQVYPGLLRLWRRFHDAEPGGPNLAGPLMARLARALIDPDYADGNSWVEKGRQMFRDAGPRWDDPAEIRRIGVLLGNDLGQMRVQYNAKTDVVQPAYRDDHQGLWDFGPPPPESAQDPDVVEQTAQIRQTEDQNDPHQREKQEANPDPSQQAGQVRLVEDEGGFPTMRLAEWDNAAGRLRPDWVTIMDYPQRQAPSAIIDSVVERYAEVERRIAALVDQARVSRPKRLRRQAQGDRLDIDAAIRFAVDRRAGLSPDVRVYETTALLERDLSVLLLLDISESTKDTVGGTTTSVFSLERAATALLAEAMAGTGDPFAIHAFCSDGRQDVRITRIKDFDIPYGSLSKSRLAGLRPGFSTRMGAALRHAGQTIATQHTHRKLVLVVTDGEPSDVDVSDRRYLIEDARKAVQELAHAGIDTFCVALDKAAEAYPERIFGRRNFMRIANLEALPERLPMLYFRLTA